jgi:hypothetical protein
MKISLKRLGNFSQSYSYTDKNGVEYEVINFSKEFPDSPNEWAVIQWLPFYERIAEFDTVRECREFLAELTTN